jgi:hypothetical protein
MMIECPLHVRCYRLGWLVYKQPVYKQWDDNGANLSQLYIYIYTNDSFCISYIYIFLNRLELLMEITQFFLGLNG